MVKAKVSEKDQLPAKEAAKRRDEALKRALNAPPKPHKNLGKVVPTKPTKAKRRSRDDNS